MRRANWRKYKTWVEYFSPDGLPAGESAPRNEHGELDIPEVEYDPDDIRDEDDQYNKEDEV